jgi:hypothetical protein
MFTTGLAAETHGLQSNVFASEYFWSKNAVGKKSFSICHIPKKCNNGGVLFIPPYGMGVHDLFMPAFYAVNNGLVTMRFDARNSIGVSDGKIIDYRLSTLLEDACLNAEKLIKISSSENLIIVGMSLSAPVALRLAYQYPQAMIVLFVPVIDICWTIEEVLNEHGGMEAYRARDPRAKPIQNIFGFDVKAQQFYDDMLDAGFSTPEKVMEDFHGLRDRVHLVLAEHDKLIRPDLTQGVIDATFRAPLILKGVGHEFGRSLVAAKLGFRHLIELALSHRSVPEIEQDCIMPLISAVVAHANLEQQAIGRAVNMMS